MDDPIFERNKEVLDDLELPEITGGTPQRLSALHTPGHLMREISLGLNRPGSSVRSRRNTDQNGDESLAGGDEDDEMLL
jgi:hypothetical protein